MKKYDTVVIGAGHAGIEAAYLAAKLHCSVLLLTLDIDGIGRLSCNPAVGGVAKGHLVREVDALGGLIGKITDSSALGYRFLNRSKGKAVWATRVQVDKYVYPKVAREYLQNSSNITILNAKVKNIITKNNKVKGVETNFGQFFYAKTIIVCAGTFLKGKIHIGLDSFSGGRLYEESSNSLFKSIKALKLKTKHFKTGTCARLDRRTLNFSKMVEQPSQEDVEPFSFFNKRIGKNHLSCYITHTNKKTHKVISKNLKYSPLYTGKIKSTGVRYCPSLEDKIVRFSNRDQHQIFIEPEGRDSVEIYPNGISTSLPFDVQCEFIQTIKGLESAVILRPGYGIEHGVIDARELSATLQTQTISGLYFAGQLNGTTGYEEAAAQGAIAGINAALSVKGKNPFVLDRSDAFIGVLIDDLVNKGTNEPYRMFTSRSEFRLSVREGNAAFRLMPKAYKLGLINKEEYALLQKQKTSLEGIIKDLRSTKVTMNGKKDSLANFLKRPQVSFANVNKHLDKKIKTSFLSKEAEVTIKYEGFLRREQSAVRELKNFDRIKIPAIDYSKVHSLSREVVEKLKKFNPKTLGDALKISGITPAAVLNIYSFIRRPKDQDNCR
ncbi:MAG: tRNA uridine-5-carboxymethylaminomethyl(34) synthesis enzyme MnmG [Candidatus Omnitrophica bacterium]|nr:tRNA uridine-5-carboxymethylaminomethyl(34) synthesis enzyme MnmG [Candidatus Omnitrophota bacterium]